MPCSGISLVQTKRKLSPTESQTPEMPDVFLKSFNLHSRNIAEGDLNSFILRNIERSNKHNRSEEGNSLFYAELTG